MSIETGRGDVAYSSTDLESHLARTWEPGSCRDLGLRVLVADRSGRARSVFQRMDPRKHGFRLDCLPSSFGGRLRDAPVVLLYLSPGFGAQDLDDARTDEGKDYYVRRWKGYEPMRDIKSNWMFSRTKKFGDYQTVKDKIALLN